MLIHALFSSQEVDRQIRERQAAGKDDETKPGKGKQSGG